MDNNRLQQIYDDAGRPGAQAFRFAVGRTGWQISEAEAKAFVARQATGQIFQGRIPSDGKVPGGGREDMRWQMDLIDWSKRIKKLSGGHRCASGSRPVRQDCFYAAYALKDSTSNPGSIPKDHSS